MISSGALLGGVERFDIADNCPAMRDCFGCRKTGCICQLPSATVSLKWSIRSTSRSKSWASSKVGDLPDSEGKPQSVHSSLTANVPLPELRRISVCTPAIRRRLSTSNVWPRSGWNGCCIFAKPKVVLLLWVVCKYRRDAEFSQAARCLRNFHLLDRRRDVRPRRHPVPQFVEILGQVLFVHRNRFIVDAGSATVGLHFLVCIPHGTFCNTVRFC